MSTPPKRRRPLGGRHNPITDREILDGLARHPDGAGPRALADTIERCHSSLRLPLQRLVKAGKVERTGGRNGPTVRYHLATARPTKAKPDAAIRELAALARESAPAPAAVARPATEPRTQPPIGIPVHVLQDRYDQLVTKRDLARLRVLEVEGQLAAIADELARVSA